MIRLANVWVNRCATEIMGRGEEALVEHGTVFVHQRLKLGCRLSQGRHYVEEGFVFTRENNSTLLNSCVSESSMQPPVRFYIHSSTLTSKKGWPLWGVSNCNLGHGGWTFGCHIRLHRRTRTQSFVFVCSDQIGFTGKMLYAYLQQGVNSRLWFLPEDFSMHWRECPLCQNPWSSMY